MKKTTIFLAFGLCAAMLAGCQKAEQAPAATEPAAAPAPAEAPATEETAPKTINPVPATLDINALDDCSFAASFPASAVVTGADGVTNLTLTVYDCDKFDLVDISQLAPGDTLVLEGQSIPITTVEHNDVGVALNGGVGEGGWDLTSTEDGVFVPTYWDAGPIYHTLGEVTLPLDEAFVFTDRSDLSKPGVPYTAAQWLESLKADNTEYYAASTTVTVAGGKIVGIALDYMP